MLRVLRKFYFDVPTFCWRENPRLSKKPAVQSSCRDRQRRSRRQRRRSSSGSSTRRRCAPSPCTANGGIDLVVDVGGTWVFGIGSIDVVSTNSW